MKQAIDFKTESDALFALLQTLNEQDWERKTQFKNWSINEIIIHLHYWNQMVDLSLNDPAQFDERIKFALKAIQNGTIREIENAAIIERGESLLSAWHALYSKIGDEWKDLDPKLRVKWAGPSMSVRSSMTARQMETWAHGQAIFDVLSKERSSHDRIKNIVILGVNTYGWSFTVNNLDAPKPMPHLSLKSPSDELWEFGEPQSQNTIKGLALDFAQVVTQTRNIKDTGLKVSGDVANQWMAIAQCFAGLAMPPPKAGTRFMLPTPAPFNNTYQCFDGKEISVAAIDAKSYKVFISLFGIATYDLAGQHDKSQWPQMVDRFAAHFQTKTRDEWMEIFKDMDAFVTPVA